MWTKTRLEEWRNDFAEAMKQLEQKYGVQAQLGHIRYSHTEFHCQLIVTEVVDGKSAEQLQFEKYASTYSLTAEHFGRTFKSNGKEYILCGLNPMAPKYPILGREKVANGKTPATFKFSERVLEQVREAPKAQVQA